MDSHALVYEKNLHKYYILNWYFNNTSVNFVFRKPTLETSELIPIEWPLFKEGEMKYLEINENFSLQSNYEPTKMAIFSELYDKYKI